MIGCAQTPLLPTLPVQTATTVVISAAPDRGFNYPYVVRLPAGLTAGGRTFLLVEPNNAGHPSKDLVTDITEARSLAENGVGANVSRQLHAPLLVPVFPRPEEPYTHSLNRPTLQSRDVSLRRIDLQLLAMVDDARRRLMDMGLPIPEKFLLTGFSASGAFVNRFAVLHPAQLQAVAAGGVNGTLVLPLTRLDSMLLPFPIGVDDLGKLVGQPFQRETWLRLPQFIYMGAEDENDAVLWDDAYSPCERSLIFRVLGEQMQPERWRRCQELYREAGANVDFRTYAGIGHKTNRTIHSEIADFFRRSSAETKDR